MLENHSKLILLLTHRCNSRPWTQTKNFTKYTTITYFSKHNAINCYKKNSQIVINLKVTDKRLNVTEELWFSLQYTRRIALITINTVINKSVKCLHIKFYIKKLEYDGENTNSLLNISKKINTNCRKISELSITNCYKLKCKIILTLHEKA